MANVIRFDRPWAGVSDLPLVLRTSGADRFPFGVIREVRCPPAGSFDYEETSFRATLLFDPLKSHVRGGPAGVASMASAPGATCINLPGDVVRGGWEGISRVLLVELHPIFIADLLHRPFDSDTYAHWTCPLPSSRPVVGGLLSALYADFNTGRPSPPLFYESVITALLTHLGPPPRRRRSYEPQPGSLSPRELTLALDLIEHGLSSDLRLTDMAQALDLSTRHFTRAFRAATGLSPYQYVLQRRMERARQLINDNVLGLAEIALQVGFTDQSHMTTTFRRLSGTTPGRLQKDARHNAGKRNLWPVPTIMA